MSGGGGPISTVDACKPGYILVSGSTACAVDATDDCTSNRCGAGGTCCDGTFTNANAGCSNNGLNMFTCACATGYTGGGQDTPCVIDITDDCSDSPCGPGGTCCDGVFTGGGGCSNDGVKTFSCSCAAGYTGGGQATPCTVDKTDDCSPNPCGAGGTCTDDYAFAYDCSCATYFTHLGQPHNGRCYATGCSQPANPTDGTKNPCLNGAKGCAVSGGRAVCDCAYGWAGETCAVDIDECASSPCGKHGTCTEAIDSYSCNCDIDWSGDHCQTTTLPTDCSGEVGGINTVNDCGWCMAPANCFNHNAYTSSPHSHPFVDVADVGTDSKGRPACEGSSCRDCAGAKDGTATVDRCGTCDADSSNDCTPDCAGIFGSTKAFDVCNVCTFGWREYS